MMLINHEACNHCIMKLATPTHEEQLSFRNFVMQPKVANHPYRKMEQKWLPFLAKNL
jgi:hypothetical protein